MRQLMFLLILCLSHSAYGQSLIISEVSSGTDWVEIHNPITNPPIDPTGYTVFAAQLTVCPAATVPGGPNGGGYTIVNPGAVMIPPGGYYVVQDLGVPAGPATVAAIGERTGFNWGWGSSSYGEVALYDPSGVGIDYMCWISVTSNGYPALFFDEEFHNNPPDTLWRTGPITRLSNSSLHAFMRVNFGGLGVPSYPDNDVNTDWFNAGTAVQTPGVDNIGIPSNQVLSRGVDLAVRENPVLSIDVAVDSPAAVGFPPEDLFIFISFTQLACTGTGPVFGLAIDTFPQLFAPLGSLTHPVLLPGSASNNYFTIPSPGIITALGLTLEVRALVWDPVAPSVTLSNIVRCPDLVNPLNCP